MTAPRERRRPGGGVPFPLIPHVEPIVSAAIDTPPPASQVESTHGQAAERAPSSASGPIAAAQDAKVARTFQLRSRTLGAAQTAVLLTAAHQGGYASLNALVEGALNRELQRLADEFSGGEAFPAHVGKFRTGKPIGS